MDRVAPTPLHGRATHRANALEFVPLFVHASARIRAVATDLHCRNCGSCILPRRLSAWRSKVKHDRVSPLRIAFRVRASAPALLDKLPSLPRRNTVIVNPYHSY